MMHRFRMRMIFAPNQSGGMGVRDSFGGQRRLRCAENYVGMRLNSRGCYDVLWCLP